MVTSLALASCGAAPESPTQDDANGHTSQTKQQTLSGGADSEKPTPTPTAQAISSSEEAKPGGPLSTEKVQAYPAQGTQLSIADVRVGEHEGFDRVVFEFSGEGAPGYVAGYTPKPLQQASGYPIEVAGGAYLEVLIQGTPMSMINPNDELVKAGPMKRAAGNVQGITHGGVFEADTQYFIGLDKQRPYSLYVLENPTRVVVDVAK
ncbi:hypothetical protein C3E79_06740 [Corynebacterium liangguodongii]|uniref:AMIN-like domain-containing protein n=1 Tax=Corynebacterium liangguodongii TaxID=2079535 RepID=A0A2S0WEX4_9CORY|nr:hypothetical protein C3E79_06740 [Corynebacterium liangguodongii]PWC00222.1 hypothetical protein DF219_03375 [Corynebacterium liangguodongii]